jgi:hypothetical protein
MELPELSGSGVDDHASIAVELATSPSSRGDMRGHITGRRHRLFDGAAVKAAFADCLHVELARIPRGGPT